MVRESVSLYEAKTQLSSLVEEAAKGAEIIITKSGKPKARLVPMEAGPPERPSGRGRGKWRVGPEFDAPLPPDVVAEFEGRRR
jgi:prevent-host-death family protein